MDKAIKVIYWIATTGLCAMMFSSTIFYFRNTEIIEDMFTKFGYPTYLVIPLGIFKAVGVLTILLNFSPKLKEWAYSALFFEFVLAFFAHYMIKDGEQGGAVLAMTLLLVSYFTSTKTRPGKIKIYE